MTPGMAVAIRIGQVKGRKVVTHHEYPSTETTATTPAGDRQRPWTASRGLTSAIRGVTPPSRRSSGRGQQAAVEGRHHLAGDADLARVRGGDRASQREQGELARAR